MTTPTPRTDALTKRMAGELDRPMLRQDHFIELCDHARQLERDLAAAKSELAELKAHASVEGSSDEVVRELQRVVLPSLRDYGQGYSAAVAERAAAHILALRAELAFTRHEADLFKSDATTFRAELASVKAHAEAMATKHEEIRTASVREIDRMEAQLHEAVDAYRAANPKDAP